MAFHKHPNMLNRPIYGIAHKTWKLIPCPFHVIKKIIGMNFLTKLIPTNIICIGVSYDILEMNWTLKL
jgi:hypothetical protein